MNVFCLNYDCYQETLREIRRIYNYREENQKLKTLGEDGHTGYTRSS